MTEERPTKLLLVSFIEFIFRLTIVPVKRLIFVKKQISRNLNSDGVQSYFFVK